MLVGLHELTTSKKGGTKMANELDEITGPVNADGRDVNVIDKQLTVTVGQEAMIFEIIVYVIGFVPALFVTLTNRPVGDVAFIFLWSLGFFVAGIYYWKKVQARSFFQQLQQDIQTKASTIDNYLEQRVVILQNVSPILEKAIDLDKDVMKSVAAFRSGAAAGADRNAVSDQLDRTFHSLLPAIEAYPELKAHAAIADAMRQNSYLQKEITAAREFYNDAVNLWNTSIFEWPVKKIVAAKMHCTTRIPFSASAATKEQARGVFF